MSREVAKYFSQQGFVKLKTVRNDISPGRLIGLNTGGWFGVKNTAWLNDDLLQFAENPPTVNTRRDAAIFEGLVHNRVFTATAALNFLDAVMPMKISSSVTLSSNVTISQFTADIHSLGRNQPVLDEFVRRDRVAAVVVDHWANDWWPYLTTLTIVVRSLEIKSVDRVAVTTTIDVGKTATVESKGAGSIIFDRTDEQTLTLSGDTPFVIALSASSIRVRDGRVVDLEEYEILSKKAHEVFTSLALLPPDALPSSDDLDLMGRLGYVAN